MQRQQTSSILHNTVIVFSKNYLPLANISLKRAVILLVTGQAEGLDFGATRQWEVRSPNLILQVPEHIRLKARDPKRHWKIPPVNRREVLRRDNHTCQYCGSKKHLPIDHILPRSKGGTHTWDNVVTACERCNALKSDRLLHNTPFTLIQKPKTPMHPAVAFAEQFWQNNARGKA